MDRGVQRSRHGRPGAARPTARSAHAHGRGRRGAQLAATRPQRRAALCARLDRSNAGGIAQPCRAVARRRRDDQRARDGALAPRRRAARPRRIVGPDPSPVAHRRRRRRIRRRSPGGRRRARESAHDTDPDRQWPGARRADRDHEGPLGRIRRPRHAGRSEPRALVLRRAEREPERRLRRGQARFRAVQADPGPA